MRETNNGVIHTDCITYSVLGWSVDLYSDTLEIGINTIAEIDNRFIYLGAVEPNIFAAIQGWEQYNGRKMNDQEKQLVLQDNNLNP